MDVEWVEGMPYVFFTFFGCRAEDGGGGGGDGEGDDDDESWVGLGTEAGTTVYGRSCRITFLLSFAARFCVVHIESASTAFSTPRDRY